MGRANVSAPAYRIEIMPLPADEGGGYVAWVPDLPGCMSDGDSPAEALKNVEQAIGEWIEEAKRQGTPIPAPSREAAVI
jgi:antitoxin HicB